LFARLANGATRPFVIAPANRAKIDAWINEAPEFRKVETEPLANDAWEIRALEDGQIVFEDAEVDTDEPVLRRLANWCEEHTKLTAKPPVKAGPAHARDYLPRRRVGS
jgi:hypothetical protein